MTHKDSHNEPAWYRVTPVRAVGLVLAASVVVLGAAAPAQSKTKPNRNCQRCIRSIVSAIYPVVHIVTPTPTLPHRGG